ncbi:MAG: T9SS type A sorting domain-containing protein [Saprospiraceae bacterium]
MRNILNICACLILANISFGQTVLFSENFDSCALSQQWTFNLEGNQNVAWGVGIPTNSKADSISMNGSCFLYIDDDLTGDKTPAFKLRVISDYFNGTGFSDILFQAQVHFRRDKTEILNIFIDNGKEEFLIRQFKNSNFSGAQFNQFIEMNTDISFYASDSMRIIIEYDDDNQWGWWAGIDNIVVTGNDSGTIVLGQTFNDCALPQDWSTEIVSGVDNWQFGIFYDGRTIDGTCFAYFNDDILGEEAPLSKIRIFSPYFNADEYGTYKLVYDFIYRTYTANEYVQLYVDDGEKWIPVKTYKGDTGGPNVNQSVKEIIDLSPFRTQRMRLVWEHSDGGFAWWVGFDNVKIIGEGDINDKCNKAIPLANGMDCVVFDNTNALVTDELGLNIPNTTGKIYFTWTPDMDGEYLIATESQFNDYIEIFSGTCENAVKSMDKNKDEFGFKGEEIFVDATAQQSYIIRVSGITEDFGKDRGLGCISIQKKDDISVVPQNEWCDISTPLTVNVECIQATNIIAQLDGPLPSKNLRSRADIWFSFKPEKSGDYRFESQADFADVITLFHGSCTLLTEVQSDFNGQILDIKNVVADSTYYIQVTGYFALLEGGVCGKIVEIKKDTIANPICSLASALPLNMGCTTFEHNDAGYSGVRPVCDVMVEDDIWTSFIAPTSGTVYIRVKADFQSILSVYKGSCEKLTSLYCSKNQHHCQGYIVLEALVATEKYYIQLGRTNSPSSKNNISSCIEIWDTEPVFLPLSLDIVQECQSKGAVKFLPTATGGNQPYSYHGLGLETAVAGNDRYVIEVKDSEGCIMAVEVMAEDCDDFGCSLAAQFTTQHVTCFGESNGRIVATTTGGLEPYTIEWSNGLIGLSTENLLAGKYQVTVSDASGCSVIENIEVFQPTKIDPHVTYTTPTCFGESNGSIELFTIGGNGNYTYIWSNGSVSENLLDIPGGTYDLTITDGNNCIFTQSVVLNQPEDIQILSQGFDNPCFGDSLGKILTEVRGGTGNFDFLWSNGSTSDSLINIASGTFSVTVTDENLCQKVSEMTIEQPTQLSIQIDSLDLQITDTKNAFISINMTGGTPPYVFNWYKDNLPIEVDTSSLELDEAGVYLLLITDAQGCILSGPTWIVTKTSSVEMEENISWTIHPNPSAKEVYIYSDKTYSLDAIQVFDMLGRIVMDIHNTDILLPYKLDVTSLPSGTYNLFLHHHNKIFLSKLVKTQH